jgi:ABC-2 type transport system permease protein
VQKVALALPPTHVFEGMRGLMKDHVFDWGHFAWATGLNVVLCAIAASIFMTMLRLTRKRGLLTKFATQ